MALITSWRWKQKGVSELGNTAIEIILPEGQKGKHKISKQ